MSPPSVLDPRGRPPPMTAYYPVFYDLVTVDVVAIDMRANLQLACNGNTVCDKYCVYSHRIVISIKMLFKNFCANIYILKM